MVLIFPSPSMISALPTANPKRHPVILNVFRKNETQSRLLLRPPPEENSLVYNRQNNFGIRGVMKNHDVFFRAIGYRILKKIFLPTADVGLLGN